MKFSSLVIYLLTASLTAASGPCFAKETETPAEPGWVKQGQ